jgi:hypothetical protein
VRLGVAAVLAALLGGGCGGHGSVTTVTVTSTAPDSAAALRTYVARIDKVRRDFDAVNRRTTTALARLHAARPDRTWVTGAKTLDRSRASYAALAAHAAGIAPAAGLDSAHRRLVQSLELLGHYTGRLTRALEARDRTALASVLADRALPRRAQQLRAEWRRALAAYARGAGVTLPAWAHS